MNKLEAHTLNYPVWSVHSDFIGRTKIENKAILSELNRQTINSKSLIGCFIYDGDNILKINNVIVKEKKKKRFFEFNFFNPYYNVDIMVDTVSDKIVIEKVMNVISAPLDL